MRLDPKHGVLASLDPATLQSLPAEVRPSCSEAVGVKGLGFRVQGLGFRV